jgi:PRTRC genetic system protein E
MENQSNSNFFKLIAPLLAEGTKLQITILKDGEKLTVSLIPSNSKVKDDAKDRIVPLVVSGSVEEMDNEFISTITTPIQKSNDLFSTILSFEQSLEEAKKNSDMEKKKKEEIEKKAKAQKEKIDKTYKEIKELFDKSSFEEADKKLKAFYKNDESIKESPDAKKLNELAKSISEKVSQPNLF